MLNKQSARQTFAAQRLALGERVWACMGVHARRKFFSEA